jgi:hypothetical protein
MHPYKLSAVTFNENCVVCTAGVPRVVAHILPREHTAGDRRSSGRSVMSHKKYAPRRNEAGAARAASPAPAPAAAPTPAPHPNSGSSGGAGGSGGETMIKKEQEEEVTQGRGLHSFSSQLNLSRV